MSPEPARPPPSSPGARLDAIRSDVRRYYAERLAEHGATPLGVDWRCLATQRLRFVQLLKLCPFPHPFSLNDVGCGYGALLDFVDERHPGCAVDYLGVDLSPEMIRRARRRHAGRAGCRFETGATSSRVADWSVASGIMNVKLHHRRADWEELVAATLCGMHATSRRGFAINFMAENPEAEPVEELYRTSPERWIRFCVDELDCTVELVTGYGMREFTLLARRRAA